ANEVSSLYLLELATGKIVWQIKDPQIMGRGFTFRPDGKVLAVGDWNVKLYDVAMGKLLQELDGHRMSPITFAFSADGKRLASGGFDGIVMVWDVANVNP